MQKWKFYKLIMEEKIKILFTGFLLTEQNSRYKTLLPSTNDGTCTSNRSSQRRCFLSGGEFTNLFPSQTALHTIWLRQHNNIAKQLKVSRILFKKKKGKKF